MVKKRENVKVREREDKREDEGERKFFDRPTKKIKIMFHVFPVLCNCLPVSLSASLISYIFKDKFSIFERKNIKGESSEFFPKSQGLCIRRKLYTTTTRTSSRLVFVIF